MRTCAIALEVAGDRAAVAMGAAEHGQGLVHGLFVSLVSCLVMGVHLTFITGRASRHPTLIGSS